MLSIKDLLNSSGDNYRLVWLLACSSWWWVCYNLTRVPLYNEARAEKRQKCVLKMDQSHSEHLLYYLYIRSVRSRCDKCYITLPPFFYRQPP